MFQMYGVKCTEAQKQERRVYYVDQNRQASRGQDGYRLEGQDKVLRV